MASPDLIARRLGMEISGGDRIGRKEHHKGDRKEGTYREIGRREHQKGKEVCGG